MKKKIIIFGCQKITVDIFQFLLKDKNIEISLIVTYETLSDISKGQKSLIDIAKKNKIPTLNPNEIDKSLIDNIKKISPDIIISCYYRKIFPSELILIPRLGIVNIHPSLLPEFRGPVPTAWAILNDKKITGVTIHKIEKEIDTGDIYAQSKFKIGKNETGYELHLRSMQEGLYLFKKIFKSLISGKLKTKPQKKGGSYYGILKLDTRINWSMSAKYIKNFVRVMALPYSPAYTRLNNKYFFINKCSIYKNKDYIIKSPGKILKIYKKNKIVVSCSDGAILIENYDVYPPLTNLEKKLFLREGRLFLKN